MSQSSVGARAKRLAGSSLYTIGSGLASAGSLVARATAAGVHQLTADRSGKEEVLHLSLGALEWEEGPPGAPELGPQLHGGASQRVPLLLVGYARGFQAWSLEDAHAPRELVSRRDGPVRLLEAMPQPQHAAAATGALAGSWPLLAVVPASAEGPPPAEGQRQQRRHVVHFYSLRSHGYVHCLEFGGEVLAVRCSARLVVVALAGQLQAFDAATLQRAFTCPTFLPFRPPPLPGGQQAQPAALPAPVALGPRWLAYAADLAVPSAGSQAVARRIPLGRQDSASSVEGSAGGGASSPAGASTPGQLVQRSGQQLAAGVAAAGSKGVQFLSRRYAAWRAGPTAQQPDTSAAEAAAGALAGTVLVRDALTRRVLAHFRAHSSALAALQFDPEGTLLATASVHGHTVNVFRLDMPTVGPGGGGRGGSAASCGAAVHLYRLHRGLTPALIQGIAFAPDSAWVAVTSGRGTAHVFRTEGRGRKGAGGAGTAPGSGSSAGSGAPPVPNADGVVGAPEKRAAVGRARRAGLLSSGLAASAASAALGLMSQGAGAAPVAAGFLPCPPGSPTGGGRDAGDAGGSSLVVVTCDGLLTLHSLTPTAEGAPPGVANGSTREGESTAGAEPTPTLMEAERWDVCRQHGWPEREEPLPAQGFSAAGPWPGTPTAAAGGGVDLYGDGDGDLQQEVAQVEAVTHAGTPLWADDQFRFG